MFLYGKAGQHISCVGSLSTCIIGSDKYEELHSPDELCECKHKALLLIVTFLKGDVICDRGGRRNSASASLP